MIAELITPLKANAVCVINDETGDKKTP